MTHQSVDPARILEPGTAPTPFTAAEIRTGCPPGRQVRMLIEPPGADPYHRLTRFLSGDEEGAIQETQYFDLAGDPIDQPEQARVTWLELQGHASFPSDRTTIEPEALGTPMGELDCLRYAVGEPATVFWFALAMPGMPVRVAVDTGQGLVPTMTMVASETPEPHRC